MPTLSLPRGRSRSASRRVDRAEGRARGDRRADADGLDVLSDTELREAARADFERRTEGIAYVSPIPAGQVGPRGYRLPASAPA